MIELNIVVGTVLQVQEPYYFRAGRKANYLGDRRWTGEVVKEEYGHRGKHWFTLRVTKSEHESIKVGKVVRRQGKNLYRGAIVISQPADLEEKTRAKKTRKEIEGYDL